MEAELGVRPPPQISAYRDQVHAMCVWEHLVLIYSLAPPSVHHMSVFARAMERLESPVAVLVAIDSRARAPDTEGKEAIRTVVTRYQKRIAAFAHVVEGQGFAAAAMRSALSIISLVARHPFPQRVTATVNEAAPWLLQHLPPSLRKANDAQHVVRVVDSLRAELNGSRAAVG